LEGSAVVSKKDLSAAVAKRTGLSNAKATKILDEALGVITEALARGDEVRISGFGAFRVAQRGPRTARNPRTGERINVAATKRPVFSPGSRLVAAVRGQGKS
jgi:DNA-binding protein HU-beta